MKKVFTNFLYNLSYQIFSFILPIISIPYLTSTLSKDLIGENSVMQANCSYFVLLGMLGVTMYGAREIAKYQNKREVRSKVFIKIYVIQLLGHMAAVFFYVCYILFSPNKLLAFCYMLYIIASMTDISWFYIGIEDFRSIAIRNMFVKLASFLFLFIFVKQDTDIYNYVFTLYAPQLLINIYMWTKIKNFIDIKFGYLKHSFEKKYLVGSFSMFLPQVASSVYTILDKTVLSFFVSFGVIAIYEQGQTILRLFLAVIPSFSKVMMPRISNSIYEKKDDEVRKYMEMSSNIVSFVSFGIFFGLLSGADLFVRWYFPAGYYDVVYVLLICSPIILAVSGSNLISVQFLIPLGKQRIYTFSLILSAIINLILNFILIPFFGIYGACISSVVAEIIGFIIQLHYAKHFISVCRLFRNVKTYLMSGCLMSIVLYLCKNLFQPSFFNITLFVIFGISIYAGMTALQFQIKKVRFAK